MFADTILGMGRTSIFESAIDPEIADVTPDTVEECTGDPFEFLTGVYYESELDMMHINQAVMVCEYTYLKENGTEMVYEANVVSTMFSKIGEKIKDAWKKICAFFKSIFNWLANTVRNDAAFVKKHESKIKDIDSVDLKEFKGYTYQISGKAGANESVSDSAKKMLQTLKEKATKTSAAGLSGYVSKDTKVEDYLNSLRGEILGAGGSVSADQFATKLSETFRGKETTNAVFSNSDLTDMLEVIKSTKKTQSSLKLVYTAVKASIDALLKTAKAAEKDAAAQDEKKGESDKAKNYHAQATVLNSLTGMTTIINNKACKAITAHNRQCRSIIGKAVAKAASGKKDDEKKATGESASFVSNVFESFLG